MTSPVSSPQSVTPGIVETVDNYYVRKQLRQLMSDHAEMNRAKKVEHRPLVFSRNNVSSESEINDVIDKDLDCSKVKKLKSWKQMDTYLKWNAILTYLKEKVVDVSEFNIAFHDGSMKDIEYDPKLQQVIKLNFKGV